jgi:hypothetical protein
MLDIWRLEDTAAGKTYLSLYNVEKAVYIRDSMTAVFGNEPNLQNFRISSVSNPWDAFCSFEDYLWDIKGRGGRGS